MTPQENHHDEYGKQVSCQLSTAVLHTVVEIGQNQQDDAVGYNARDVPVYILLG